MGLYAAQIAVFYHLAKTRGFLYDRPDPRWLVSGRTLVTLINVVVVPLLFGLAWATWVRWLSQQPLFDYLWYRLFILVALPFPYFANGCIFLVARRKRWSDEKSRPEVYHGVPDAWPIATSITAAILFIGMWYVTTNAPESFQHLIQSDVDIALRVASKITTHN